MKQGEVKKEKGDYCFTLKAAPWKDGECEVNSIFTASWLSLSFEQWQYCYTSNIAGPLNNTKNGT